MFWGKIFQTKYEIVAALCDENLLEKTIERKGVKIKISKHFYGGKLIDEERAVKVMNEATIGNIIGKEIVEVAKKNGFISRENVILIDGIPHAQFVKI
jgi:uncharacterized protein